VIRSGERVFVDTGAWIALALTRDLLHPRAVELWTELQRRGARLHTSTPVILETFTFLERNANRDVALAWKDSLATVARLQVLDVGFAQLPRAWEYFGRKELHKLSAVDATSFVVMTGARIRHAFTFDHHFVTAGFRLVG
jgi:predicted nucleic acid-binding protein